MKNINTVLKEFDLTIMEFYYTAQKIDIQHTDTYAGNTNLCILLFDF